MGNQTLYIERVIQMRSKLIAVVNETYILLATPGLHCVRLFRTSRSHDRRLLLALTTWEGNDWPSDRTCREYLSPLAPCCLARDKI
ncbi:hypothetical protein TNCV_631051 [Trichonephila clavipes]|nr:hypothetical protein TNCV_631051 [Trichonephila clavipes]